LITISHRHRNKNLSIKYNAMKNSAYRARSTYILAAIAFLAGCAKDSPVLTSAPSTQNPANTASGTNPRTATNATNAATTPHTANTVPSAAQAALEAGIHLYSRGDYTAAIKRLGTAHEIWKADKPLQLEALKYMAFSYCVSGRQALCKQQFQKALKLDPSFDLAPGEKGHPLWGPVFDGVKK